MIPFSFDYFAPETLEEAITTHADLTGQGRRPLYFAGGTEIITMARTKTLAFDALIDIKQIPQCRGHGITGQTLAIGAAVTLDDVASSGVFPLLGKACARIADHTAQRKITLGGNVAGTIHYHEAALPLLLADATAHLAGPAGTREVPISALYPVKKALQPSEMIVQFTIDPGIASLPYVHAKHTGGEKIGYPLFTLTAIRYVDLLKVAISGYYEQPTIISLLLDQHSIRTESAVDRLMQQLAGEPTSDSLASGGYRRSMLVQALRATIARLGSVSA